MISDDEYTIRNCTLGFKCSANWDSMEVISIESSYPVGESEVRFCKTCQKEVFESNSDNELTTNIRLNRCVSFLTLSEDIRLTGYVRNLNE